MPANTADIVGKLMAERDENTCRKDFTPTEAVAIGEELEKEERPKAESRQAQAAGKRQGDKKTESFSNGNLPGEIQPLPLSSNPQQNKGNTRDKVASAVGMSGKTYERQPRSSPPSSPSTSASTPPNRRP